MWQSPRPSTARANQKPWLTAEVCGMLKTWDYVFRSGDKASLRDNLSHGINKAKQSYAKNEQSFRPLLTTSPSHRPVMMTHPSQMHSTISMQGLKCRITHLHGKDYHCPSSFNVRKTLSRINPCKAGSPENIPGHVLRDCAEQLTDVLTDIFNTSLSQAVILTCLITTTGTKEVIHDYLPIALNRIMKYFERLVMHHIKCSQQTLPAPGCLQSKPFYGQCNILHNRSSITWMWWASTPQHH